MEAEKLRCGVRVTEGIFSRQVAGPGAWSARDSGLFLESPSSSISRQVPRVHHDPGCQRAPVGAGLLPAVINSGKEDRYCAVTTPSILNVTPPLFYANKMLHDSGML